MTDFVSQNNRKVTNELFSSTLTFSNKCSSIGQAYLQTQCMSTPLLQSYQCQSPEDINPVKHQINFKKGQGNTKIKNQVFQQVNDYFEVTESSNSYQSIQRILKQQNCNLKQQNQLLLNEAYKLQMSTKKCKDIYRKQKQQLSKMKEECIKQRWRVDEMKEIILNKIVALKGKIKLSRKNSQSTSECDTVQQTLNLSQQNY